MVFEDLFVNGEYQKLIDLSKKELSKDENKYWLVTGLWRSENLLTAKREAILFINNVEGYWKGKLYYRLASILIDLGEYEDAKKYLILSLDYFTSQETNKDKAAVYANLGNLYSTLGDIDNADEVLQKALLVYRQLGNPLETAAILNDISDLYQKRGDITNALSFLEKSYDEVLKTDNDQMASTVLFNRLSLALETDQRKIAKNILNELDEVYQNNMDNKSIELDYTLANALYLKSSKRNREKSQAEALFIKIINDLDFIHEITLYALYQLIELLIIEFHTYGEEEVLEEIITYNNKIYEISQEKQMYPILIRSIILKSKLLRVQGEFQLSTTLLKQAEILAEENKLTPLQSEIESEIDKTYNEIKYYEEMIHKNQSLVKQVQDSKILDYIRFARDKFEENNS